jgi:hypothetical protein
MFMFERSREPCPTCLCSSGVENLFLLGRRSREPFYHLHPCLCPSLLTPCLCSSGVENPALHVYVRAESRTFFVRQAESRTLLYFTPCLCSSLSDTMFMFERSRELFTTCILVYVRAESRTLRYLIPCLCTSLPDIMFMFERSREPFLFERRSREPSFE